MRLLLTHFQTHFQSKHQKTSGSLVVNGFNKFHNFSPPCFRSNHRDMFCKIGVLQLGQRTSRNLYKNSFLVKHRLIMNSFIGISMFLNLGFQQWELQIVTKLKCKIIYCRHLQKRLGITLLEMKTTNEGKILLWLAFY